MRPVIKDDHAACRGESAGRRGTGRLLLCLAACLLLMPACTPEDDSGPVVTGKVETGASAGSGAAAEDAHPVTQEEMDELWAELSEPEQQLLEENMRGRHTWERYTAYSDPEAMWDNMDEQQRRVVEEIQQQDREVWIAQQRITGMNYDKRKIRGLLQDALKDLRPLVCVEPGVLGNAIGWRLLHEIEENREGNRRSITALEPGNFDDDPQEEVAISSRGLLFVEQDGSSWRNELLHPFSVMAAFDYDADGRDELVEFEIDPQGDGSYGYESTGLLRDMDGNVVASLPGTTFGMHSPDIDMDGDGIPELLVWQRLKEVYGELDGVRTVSWSDTLLFAIEQGGGEVFRTECSNWDNVMSGDVDGDGMDELFIKRKSETKLNAYDELFVGLEQEPQDVLAATGHREHREILALLDFNGDGRADMISSGRVYLSWNGDTTSLMLPAGYMLPPKHQMPRPRAVVWERDGQRLLAALVVRDWQDNRSDTLVMWEPDGRLVYTEHFGEEVLEIVPGDGGKRLYVLTRTRLLAGE